MYTIIRLNNGKFLGMFRLQDGTERYTYDTLKEAIKGAKSFAKTCNGMKIKKKHISFLQEQPVTEVKLVPWDPKGG
jgi:hypothetical protein